MKNPVDFDTAWSRAIKLGLTKRTRLYPDELRVLTRVLGNTQIYGELGVYDGLSAFMIGATTVCSTMVLVDINPIEHVGTIIASLGIDVEIHQGDFRNVAPVPRHAPHVWLLDAEHEYEATLEAYNWAKSWHQNSAIVLHDVEMPGPNRLLNELGGVRIVSTHDSYTSPDGKVLPKLGYGIVAQQ